MLYTWAIRVCKSGVSLILWAVITVPPVRMYRRVATKAFWSFMPVKSHLITICMLKKAASILLNALLGEQMFNKHTMASKVHHQNQYHCWWTYAHTIIVSNEDCCSWRKNHVGIDAGHSEGNTEGLYTLTRKVINNGDDATLLAVSTRDDQRVASDGAIVYTTTWSLRSREE